MNCFWFRVCIWMNNFNSYAYENHNKKPLAKKYLLNWKLPWKRKERQKIFFSKIKNEMRERERDTTSSYKRWWYSFIHICFAFFLLNIMLHKLKWEIVILTSEAIVILDEIHIFCAIIKDFYSRPTQMKAFALILDLIEVFFKLKRVC